MYRRDGGLTIDGEFYGAIRADKVAKGVRFISRRIDLTLSQLAGHMEAGRAALKSLMLRETSAYARRTTSRWRTQAARSKSTIAEEAWMCVFVFTERGHRDQQCVAGLL